ncbi:bifunctional phage-like tail fiber protein/heme utilization protein [Acinetobacter baumannii]|uniref:phage tail-collar fiber domain-containing protein n=1 Tax=Acinetobacter baumannii TaxID=470 RepID=UPI000DE668CE|nr:phage tail protein [Acinetobacter baumannii]MCJ8979510.1 phage tail protein [Acinetobacter baumannii]MCJ9372206.1 phage tail protein [Acinetobacter baumannii]MCJ9473771.1 phage tail protein [Acinetobacter baumannii]MCJ9477308.1 phage tail protein [Acinetobacter baumannii]MCJ9481168.1 phage tail protein [Acinetobacter baumannii]
MATYKGILTNNGKALIAGATVSNKINYSHIAVGDGNGSVPVPSETRTALINEKARIALNVVEINPNNTNQIVCEAIIPSNVGGFYIRELGLYAGNTMVVNASYPPTYKPLADEGGAREINIKLVINIQNAEVIALYLDDSLIYATREWVNKNYIRRNEIVDNLTTDDPARPLSAKQGKNLQDYKVQIGSSFKDAHSRDVDYYQDISSQQFFTSFDELPLGSRCLIQTSLNLTKAPVFAGEAFIYVETKATYKKDMPGKLQLAYGYGSGRFAIRSAPTDGVYTPWFYYADINSNVATASKLATARTVSFSGGATGSFNYDGSGNSSCILTLANSGVAAGSYASTIQIPQISVNAAGQITAISQQNIRAATVNQSGVVQLTDDLQTDDSTKALTAKQGRALQLLKLDKNANAVGLQMGDDRTLLPTELSPLSLQTFFGTYNSDGTSAFCDFITLNGWIDASGGRKNALVFNKISTGLYHFQADYNSQNWTIKKELAYTDSNISGNAASATRLQNARRINNVLFDGLQDISIEAPLRLNGDITDLTQVDSALKDGKYRVLAVNVAGLYSYGILVVVRTGGSCHQIYYPHLPGPNSATMAMRQTWNANGDSASWSEWRIISTQDESKLPLVGGTVTGNLRVNGIIFSNKVYGDSDLWFTSEDEQKARRVLTGGVLVSDSYSEASLVPNLGIYAKGAIHTKTGVYADKYYGYNGIATYVGNLDGRLTTPRLINGVEFDASTDINIPPVSFYIPAGADLNNYKRTGFYYQNADVDAAKITNVPQGNAFALRVEESAGCSQWLTPYNGGGVVYYRHFYDGTWSTWIKMDPHNIDGNAATATKLKNPRKIFGQDFDGSSDVAGNITTSTGMVVSDSFHYIDMGRPGVDRMNLAVYGGIFNFINAENGNVIARLNSNGIDCNAATATKLQTPRNIAISGAVSGSGNFDGSGNLSISTILNNFGSLKAENGYKYLGDGLILQWGTMDYTSYPGETKVDITFPITFPNNVLNINSTRKMAQHSASGDGGVLLISQSNSGASFSLNVFNSNSIGDLRGFTWFAIGF